MNNLDELMTVWRTQDTAPLHDVNRTLLHLALRRDEEKLQLRRRLGRWSVYVCCTGAALGMGLFLVMMIHHLLHRQDGNGLTGWDLLVPVIGAVAALVCVRAMYVAHHAQRRREQGFGETLRDQLKRSIARLDDERANARGTTLLVLVLAGGICPAAIILIGWRINQKPLSDDGFLFVNMIFWCAWSVACGIWGLRRSIEKEILPRKKRLEELLGELETEP